MTKIQTILSKIQKENIAFDIDMYYKGNVVYPISYELKQKTSLVTFAYKGSNGEILLGYEPIDHNIEMIRIGFSDIEELLKVAKQELKTIYKNKMSKATVGNPYLE